MEKLEQEYQQVMWKSVTSSTINMSKNSNNLVHFLDSGSVCLFQLSPLLNLGTDSSYEHLTIDDSQLQLLKQVLKEGDLRTVNVPTPRGNVNGLSHQLPLTTLVVLSPIQMIYPTSVPAESSSEYTAHQLKYANGIVQAILDVISDWIIFSSCPDFEKEVVFVCPSTNAKGQTIRVKGYVAESMNVFLSDDPDPLAPYEGVVPHLEFTQLCCGPSVSITSQISIPPPAATTTTSAHVDEEKIVEREEEEQEQANVVAVQQPPLDDEGENTDEKMVTEPLHYEEGLNVAETDKDMGDNVNNDEMQDFNYEKEFGEGYGYGYEYTPPAESYDYPLYTNKGRVFVSTVEKTITEPHCGMLNVGGNVTERKRNTAEVEANKKLPPEDQQYVDTVEYSAVTSLLRLEEMFDLEIYLSNSDIYRIPMVIQDALNYLKTILLTDKNVILNIHPRIEDEEGHVNDDNQQQTAEYSFEIKTICKAVHEVCKRCEKLFTKCYGLYQQDVFGGGVGYDSLKNSMINYQYFRDVSNCPCGITKMLMNIFQWLVKELPNNMRSIFPSPTPFLMKQFWIFFAENYCMEHYNHVKKDRSTTVSLNEVALLTLHADSALFVKLCCEGLRCIALFTQVSVEFGVTDYNKW